MRLPLPALPSLQKVALACVLNVTAHFPFSLRSELHLVGTSNTSNVFRVRALDLLAADEIRLTLPKYTGKPITVIINVLYENDYTGAYATDPSGLPKVSDMFCTLWSVICIILARYSVHPRCCRYVILSPGASCLLCGSIG